MKTLRGGPPPALVPAVIDDSREPILSEAIARACRELPPGSAVEQLRNFSGRCWEMLHTPEFARIYRTIVSEAANPEQARAYNDSVFAPLYRALQGIIERGVTHSEFRMVNPYFAARLIVAALVQQAFWCNHPEGFAPSRSGGCNRIVTDTLSIVLGGIARE